jgi:hypothetical protein
MQALFQVLFNPGLEIPCVALFMLKVVLRFPLLLTNHDRFNNAHP